MLYSITSSSFKSHFSPKCELQAIVSLTTPLHFLVILQRPTFCVLSRILELSFCILNALSACLFIKLLLFTPTPHALCNPFNFTAFGYKKLIQDNLNFEMGSLSIHITKYKVQREKNDYSFNGFQSIFHKNYQLENSEA